jgi:hypothetical protein
VSVFHTLFLVEWRLLQSYIFVLRDSTHFFYRMKYAIKTFTVLFLLGLYYLQKYWQNMDFEERKLYALHFILCCECNFTNFKRRRLDLFCNYCHIQCACNHSTPLVVIFCCNLSFCHIFGTSKILSLT